MIILVDLAIGALIFSIAALIFITGLKMINQRQESKLDDKKEE